jgi:hypothetical protein
VIVQSLFDIAFAVRDMLSTWIYFNYAILQAPHTTRRCDVVLVGTPYHASSGPSL